MKGKTKWLALVLTGAMIIWVGRAWAADSDDCQLSVTVSNAVSVTVVDATYNFSSVALGAVTINTSGIRVNNNSGGIREDYRLSLLDATDPTNQWSLGASAGADVYNVRGIFASLQPADANFASNDDLSASVTAASASAYAYDTGADTEKGYDVVDNTTTTHEKTLWFRLAMPTSITGQPAAPFATVWVSAIGG